jgi:hypothetical protein
VEGPDPTVTPANGGYRRAAPSRNLGVRRGQRPSIHKTPAAPATKRPPGFSCRERHPARRRHGPPKAGPNYCTTRAPNPPAGRAETDRSVEEDCRGGAHRRAQRTAAAGDPQAVMSPDKPSDLPSSHPSPERRSNRQGRRCRRGTATRAFLLHILSDITWERKRCAIVNLPRNGWQGPGLVWGWSVHEFFCMGNWASSKTQTAQLSYLAKFVFTSRDLASGHPPPGSRGPWHPDHPPSGRHPPPKSRPKAPQGGSTGVQLGFNPPLRRSGGGSRRPPPVPGATTPEFPAPPGGVPGAKVEIYILVRGWWYDL